MQDIYVDIKEYNNLNDYDGLSIEEIKEFIDPLFKPMQPLFNKIQEFNICCDMSYENITKCINKIGDDANGD